MRIFCFGVTSSVIRDDNSWVNVEGDPSVSFFAEDQPSDPRISSHDVIYTIHLSSFTGMFISSIVTIKQAETILPLFLISHISTP